MSAPEVWRRGAGGEHQTQIPSLKILTVDLKNPGRSQVVFFRDQPYIINRETGELERPPEWDIPILKGIQFAQGKLK